MSEAKERLTYAEFLKWAEFRRKRGRLNPAWHMERGFAMLAKIYLDSHRKKGAQPIPLWQLMPHEDEPEISLSDAMRMWQ